MIMIKEDLMKRMSEEEAECLINKSKSSLQSHFDQEGINTSIEDYFNELGSLKKLAIKAKEDYIRLRKTLINLQKEVRKAKEYYESLDKSLAFLDGRYKVIEPRGKKKKKEVRELSREDLLGILASLKEDQ